MAEGHNVELLKKRQQIRCTKCGLKTRTIAQPNDSHRLSRSAQYRTVCDKCKKTYIVSEAFDYKDFADGAKPYLIPRKTLNVRKNIENNQKEKKNHD